MKRFLQLAILFLLASPLYANPQPTGLPFVDNIFAAQGQNFGGGGGLSFVATLPATCTPGVTPSVQLSVSAYTINYCSATNTWIALTTGTGAITNQAAKAIPANAGGVATTLDSVVCTPPTANGTYNVNYIVTASVAVAPGCPQVGLAASTISGSTTTYTVTATDAAASLIVHDLAGSQSVAVTLPTPTTITNSTAIVTYENRSTHTDTITPTTWTIQLNGAAAGASATVPPGTRIQMLVDPFNATNWIATSFSLGGGGVFPQTVSGTVNSGGIPCFNSATNEQSSASIGAGILIKGGGAGACAAASSITDNATTVSTTEAIITTSSVATGTSPPTCTVGTGGGHCFSEGTAFTGASSVDGIYADSGGHCIDIINQTANIGCGVGVLRAVMVADWTCGTGGTVSSCATATIIGSGGGTALTITLPLAALSWDFDCDGVVGSATGDPANNWNILTATNAPTNVTAYYTMGTAAAVGAFGASTDFSSTSTTVIGGAWTLGGTATKMPFHIHARIEGASASGTVVSLQLVDPTVADLLTIYRGASCVAHN